MKSAMAAVTPFWSGQLVRRIAVSVTLHLRNLCTGPPDYHSHRALPKLFHCMTTASAEVPVGNEMCQGAVLVVRMSPASESVSLLALCQPRTRVSGFFPTLRDAFPLRGAGPELESAAEKGFRVEARAFRPGERFATIARALALGIWGGASGFRVRVEARVLCQPRTFSPGSMA